MFIFVLPLYTFIIKQKTSKSNPKKDKRYLILDIFAIRNQKQKKQAEILKKLACFFILSGLVRMLCSRFSHVLDDCARMLGTKHRGACHNDICAGRGSQSHVFGLDPSVYLNVEIESVRIGVALYRAHLLQRFGFTGIFW